MAPHAMLSNVTPSQREQALRQLLLDELQRIGGHTLGGQDLGAGMSYAEKKRLVEETDPAFTDEELEKMRASQRMMWWTAALIVLMFAAFLGNSVLFGAGWTDFMSGFGAGFMLMALPVGAYQITHYQQTKQRIFIYRALRLLASGSAEAASRPAEDASERIPARAAV